MALLPRSQGICYHLTASLPNYDASKMLSFSHLRTKNRAGGIRTHDLLNPIQAHYQAVLRPDLFQERQRCQGQRALQPKRVQGSQLGVRTCLSFGAGDEFQGDWNTGFHSTALMSRERRRRNIGRCISTDNGEP
jgi:hypothetical protein